MSCDSNTMTLAWLRLPTYRKRCSGSVENAVLAAVVPLPHSGALHSRPMKTCVTYLPSMVNTCTRLPPRSET